MSNVGDGLQLGELLAHMEALAEQNQKLTALLLAKGLGTESKAGTKPKVEMTMVKQEKPKEKKQLAKPKLQAAAEPVNPKSFSGQAMSAPTRLWRAWRRLWRAWPSRMRARRARRARRATPWLP